MTDQKKPPLPEMTTDIMIADALLRITALETLLIQKKVISVEELQSVTQDLTEKVSKAILSKLQISKNLDEFISALKGEKSETPKN